MAGYFPYALGGAALGYAAARRGRGRLAYKFPPKPKPWVSPHMEQLREDLYAAGVPRSTEIRIEAYPPGHVLEGFKVEMVDESAPAPVQYGVMGYFRATRVNEKGWEWLNAPRECDQALKRLRRMQPHIKGVWVVPGVELFDPRLRGKGIGRVMYRHALEAADRAGAALMPHECLGGGATSQAAKKAYQSLPGDQEGWIYYLPRGKGRANQRGRGRRAPTGLCFPFVLDMAKNSTNEEFFDKSNFQVVHGDVWDVAHGRYTPHAWVEKGGRAFDWQTRTFRPEGWEIQEFRDYYRAKNMVTYTAEEVTINCIRTGHQGPWEPHERAKGRGPLPAARRRR